MPDAGMKVLPIHMISKAASALFISKKMQPHFFLPVEIQKLLLLNQINLISKRTS